jgi:hypothetical protein
MAPGRARDEQKEQQWRCWIGGWRASGLSVRAFRERRGLATPSSYALRRTPERRRAAKLAFVPVQVVAVATPAQASALEVVLADGWILRVAPGFDAATLRGLLSVWPVSIVTPELAHFGGSTFAASSAEISRMLRSA